MFSTTQDSIARYARHHDDRHPTVWLAVRHALDRLTARFQTYRKARATQRQLRGLSDHHLHDIGLDRADLERTYPDPVFRDLGDTLHRYRDMIDR